jgi:hypothetical protein
MTHSATMRHRIEETTMTLQSFTRTGRTTALAAAPLLLAAALLFAAPILATAQPIPQPAAQPAAGAPAATLPDCSKLAPEMRPRCEEALKSTRACAGLSGEALKNCQQKNSEAASVREDCSKAAAADRAACDARNRRADIAARCGGKTGDELRRCAEAMGPATAPAR